MAKRTKYERKRGRGMASDGQHVAGVRKRDKRGVQVSGRDTRLPPPDLRYRKSLFPGQERKAWQPEAGYPLGVYWLRGDLTREQFETGQRWAAARVNADRLLGLPARLPRAVDLSGVTGAKLLNPTLTPSESEIVAVERFMAFDAKLRKTWTGQHRALELCIVYEVMGLRAERRGGEGYAQYSPAALAMILDRIRLGRGVT